MKRDMYYGPSGHHALFQGSRVLQRKRPVHRSAFTKGTYRVRVWEEQSANLSEITYYTLAANLYLLLVS